MLSLLPPSTPLAPSGPPFPPRVGAIEQIPESCLTGASLSAYSAVASGSGRMPVIHRAPGTSAIPSLMGEGAPAPTAAPAPQLLGGESPGGSQPS